jgi:MoaA/NifB/PqqE/SkfB family radical SAM enzyme
MTENKLWRAALEFNLTEHCNLRCEHCDHASSMLPTKFADLASFVRDLDVLSAVVHAREFKFVGGEPLLHPKLPEFLRAARNAKIADRLVLVTNGTLLHKAPDELWDLIDGMWISLYPGIKYRFDWDWVQQIADEHQIYVWRKETPDFSERSLIKPIESQSFIRMIYENCDLAHLFSCHTIHEGRYYLCSPSVWTEPRLSLHGIAFKNRISDSIAIHDNPNLFEDLDNLLRRKEPLDACRYCLGSWARRTPNEQLTRKGIQQFVTRQPEELADLVNPEWIVPKSYTRQDHPE